MAVSAVRAAGPGSAPHGRAPPRRLRGVGPLLRRPSTARTTGNPYGTASIPLFPDPFTQLPIRQRLNPLPGEYGFVRRSKSRPPRSVALDNEARRQAGRGADFALGGRPASWASIFAPPAPWVRPVYAPANDVGCRCAPRCSGRAHRQCGGRCCTQTSCASPSWRPGPCAFAHRRPRILGSLPAQRSLRGKASFGAASRQRTTRSPTGWPSGCSASPGKTGTSPSRVAFPAGFHRPEHLAETASLRDTSFAQIVRSIKRGIE